MKFNLEQYLEDPKGFRLLTENGTPVNYVAHDYAAMSGRGLIIRDNNGDIQVHGLDGTFMSDATPSCLDLTMVEVTKAREVKGMAYVNEAGQIVGCLFDQGSSVLSEVKAYPCTLVIDAEPAIV